MAAPEVPLEVSEIAFCLALKMFQSVLVNKPVEFALAVSINAVKSDERFSIGRTPITFVDKSMSPANISLVTFPAPIVEIPLTLAVPSKPALVQVTSPVIPIVFAEVNFDAELALPFKLPLKVVAVISARPDNIE